MLTDRPNQRVADLEQLRTLTSATSWFTALCSLWSIARGAPPPSACSLTLARPPAGCHVWTIFWQPTISTAL